MAESFEIMKLWVPLKLNYDSSREEVKPGELYTVTYTPVDDEATAVAWEKASELAKDGWDLIGAVPLTAYSFPAERPEITPRRGLPPFKEVRDLSHSYTAGYELLFRRRILPDHM